MVRPHTSSNPNPPSPPSRPERPAAWAERNLVSAIVEGRYPAGSSLPAERELAVALGVTRPTLREVLKRLDRDGWITVQHGKPTRVNDVMTEGGLNVLSAIARSGQALPAGFVSNLLEVRLALAPAYAAAAVARSAGAVLSALAGAPELADEPAAFARFDWELHRALTIASGNPVFTLVLNGFAGLYEEMARLYFEPADAREVSRGYYARLAALAAEGDAAGARHLTETVMARSLALWGRGEKGSVTA